MGQGGDSEAALLQALEQTAAGPQQAAPEACLPILDSLAPIDAVSSPVIAQISEPMAFLLASPLMAATQTWEIAHQATGLPWWATIPLTTVAVRSMLLPMTIRAKAASVNFLLYAAALRRASAQPGHLQVSHCDAFCAVLSSATATLSFIKVLAWM